MLEIHHFEKFSNKLVKTISRLKHLANSFRKNNDKCRGRHLCSKYLTVEMYYKAEQDSYSNKIQCLRKRRKLPSYSSILALSPYLDVCGLLRVGGKINKLKNIFETERIHNNPVILQGRHHVGEQLIRHFHAYVKHQETYLTEGAIRDAGYCLVEGKLVISSNIRRCVECRKLRRKPESQNMADLPVERLTPATPFTYVGIHTFGP